MLFHLKQMRFPQSTHLLMYLALAILTFIVRTGLPVLVELIDLVNSMIISCQMTLLGLLKFQLEPLTVTLKVLLFWI